MISNETEIKEFLNIDNTNLDEIISDARAYADSQVHLLLGQNIEETTESVSFFGGLTSTQTRGNRYYFNIKNYPVQSISSITYKEYGEDAETLASTEYELVNDNIPRVMFKERLNAAYLYTIEYVYGHASESLPSEVVLLANFYAIDYILKSWQDGSFKRYGLDTESLSNERGSFNTNYVSEPAKLEQRVKNQFGLWI